jgi:hypothetical protein
MKLYEVNVVSATYWCAANNAPEAMRVMLKCWQDEGAGDEDTTDASFENITDLERAQKLTVRGDGVEPAEKMLDAAARATEPVVIACTEWP